MKWFFMQPLQSYQKFMVNARTMRSKRKPWIDKTMIVHLVNHISQPVHLCFFCCEPDVTHQPINTEQAYQPAQLHRQRTLQLCHRCQHGTRSTNVKLYAGLRRRCGTYDTSNIVRRSSCFIISYSRVVLPSGCTVVLRQCRTASHILRT